MTGTHHRSVTETIAGLSDERNGWEIRLTLYGTVDDRFKLVAHLSGPARQRWSDSVAIIESYHRDLGFAVEGARQGLLSTVETLYVGVPDVAFALIGESFDNFRDTTVKGYTP